MKQHARLVTHILLGLFFIMCTISGAALFFITHHTIDFAVLEQTLSGQPTILLDDEGKEWARFELDRRAPVAFHEIPPCVINAFIAAEDRNFFHHYGISWKGIIRSIAINLYHGARKQGASTITQQLVRLLFFDARKTFSRKIKEQCYALLVEQQFSKEYILTTYLNNIYFGSGIYGIQAAAQRFWNKSAAELQLSEAALLAAIVRSPRQYNPLQAPQAATNRRNLVLSLMQQIGFITPEAYFEAIAEPLGLVEKTNQTVGAHVKELLRQQLEELFGKDALYRQGFVVQTTISTRMQKNAEGIFKKECDRLRTELHLPLDGGLLSIDIQTGGIKALVGGYDFTESKFNRATQARRQMGSIFKPLIYALAVEKGAHFSDTSVDEPLIIQDNGSVWRPNNYNMRFDGQVTLAYALSRSNNIVAIKTLLQVGIKEVINVAKRCHIQGPFAPYPSLALGCVDGTLVEAVGMFNIFAHGGMYVEPHTIHWIKNRWGTKIWKKRLVKERIFDRAVNDQVAYVLGLGIERLRKLSPREWIDCQVISKTGTTNDSRTCWFMGSDPHCTTGIYIGCDDNRSMGKNVYPVKTAFPIWKGLHRATPSTLKHFTFDPSLQLQFVDQYTGAGQDMAEKQTISVLV